MLPKNKNFHQSNWRWIYVLDNNQIIKYDLDGTGRLKHRFGRSKPRNLDEMIQKMNINSNDNSQNEIRLSTNNDLGKKNDLNHEITNQYSYDDDIYELFNLLENYDFNF